MENMRYIKRKKYNKQNLCGVYIKGVTMKQYMNLVKWYELKLIDRTTIDQTEYLKIKKDLTTKGLI